MGGHTVRHLLDARIRTATAQRVSESVTRESRRFRRLAGRRPVGQLDCTKSVYTLWCQSQFDNAASYTKPTVAPRASAVRNAKTKGECRTGESCTPIVRGTRRLPGIARDQVNKARAPGAQDRPQNATTCDRDVTKYPKSQVVVALRKSVNQGRLGKLR